MSDISDVLWQVHNDPPGGHEAQLAGNNLSFEAGQQAQVNLLKRWLDAGESIGGWKIGMTSGANRNAMGDGIRPFGFVLASRIVPSGSTLPLEILHKGQIENELCLTLGRSLGSGTTRYDAIDAVAHLVPAFEINQKRIPKDVSAGVRVADNLSNWGIVVGTGADLIQGTNPELDDMQVTLSDTNGSIESVNSRGHIDDPFDSLAILANTLAEYGLALEAGHQVITGAYGKTPFAPGTYTGHFDCGVGDVTITLQ